MWMLQRVRLLKFAAAVTASLMIVVACSGPDRSEESAQAPTAVESESEGVLARGEGEVSHHGLTVTVGDDLVALSIVEFDETAAEGLLWLVNQGVAISPPMLVTTDAAGGTLTKEFPEQLPEGWGAGFMTIDEGTGEFVTVEAEFSNDRRSMTAQVEHFSKWWDYLVPSEIGETMRVGFWATVEDTKELGRRTGEALNNPAVIDAAEKIDYMIGGALTTRVDPPTCSGALPSWAADVHFIEQHFNNPIHFCAGSAPRDSEILEVKVRINRGFGMTLTSSATPVSAANTTYSGIGDGVAAFASDVSQSMANGLGPLLEGGSFLGAGQEGTLQFDEASVRSGGSGPLITVNAPSALTFAVGQMASVLTTAGLSLMDATTLAVAGVASCSAEMMRTDGPADAVFGSAKCGMTYLSDHADQLVGATGGVLSKAALQRASLVLTAGAAIHNYLAYQLSRGLEVGGRTVTVITSSSPQRDTPTACSVSNFGLDLGGATGPAAERAREIYSAAVACDRDLLVAAAVSDGTRVTVLGPAQNPDTLFAFDDPQNPYYTLAALMSTRPGFENGTLYWPYIEEGELFPDLAQLHRVGLWGADTSEPLDGPGFYIGWRIAFGPSGEWTSFYAGE